MTVCGISKADGVCVMGKCQHLNLCIEDIQGLLAYKSAYIRQKNAKELKRKWEDFLKRQEEKYGKH